MTVSGPAGVLDLLATFQPGDDVRARESVVRTRTLLATATAPFARSHFAPGHVTASAVVLSEDERVLLVHHQQLARWLQPGGHVEPDDPSLIAAARREVLEETGVRLPLSPAPPLVRVDVHAIPAARGEPEHWHHDFMFGFRLAEPAQTEADGARIAWAPLAALGDYALDDALLRGVERAARQLPS